MLKRQIVLLALLEEFEGQLPNTEMLKYLFLLTRFQDKKSYHFVPYKYGCFSFNAYADKRKLVEKNFLKNNEDWTINENQGGFYFMLPAGDRDLVKKIKKEFGGLRGKELIRYIYLNYPYYAINSEILREVLSGAEIQKIEACAPQNATRAIYTIGYEDRSLEEYINCLLKEGVKVLCDVRKNPISRKYGFSKKTLMNALEAVGIEYRHFPELGIPSVKRANLKDLQDYIELFDMYEEEVLSRRHDFLEIVYRLFLKSDRVALTCFERLPEYCHRTRVAAAILRLFDRNLSIVEL